MAAEGDASQSAPAGNEKPQASKAAPSFVSTFINKNTGGKKFAPKAARRRPGAAAPSASQRPSTPPSTIPETQTTQVPTAQAPTTEPQTAVQDALPTPATTQETGPQEDLRIEQTGRESRAPEISIETVAPVATPDATPSQPTVGGTVDQQDEGTHTTQPAISRRAEEELDSSHSRKRQRVENAQDVDERASVLETSAAVPILETATIVETTQPDTQITAVPTPEQPQADTAQSTAEQFSATTIAITPADAIADGNGEVEESDVVALEIPAPVQPRRGQRRVSWVTVNQRGGEEDEGTEAVTSAQPPGRRSGKRRTTSTNEVGDLGAAGDDEEVRVTTSRTTRGRSNRSAVNSAANEWEPEALPKPPTKPRKPRKDKGTKKKKQGETIQEGQNGEEAELVPNDDQRPKKKRAPRRKKSVAEAGTGEGGADGAAEDHTQPRRPKGRRREATPSDAEDQVIDTANTFMDGLASHRGPRTGQISQREQKMRNIDWDAVKQRRREENAIGVDPVGSRRAVDEALAQAGEARAEALAAQSRGPQFREVNGQIVLVQEAAVIDREADADREIELMEEVEEDDLTSRVTAASYLREDKRFPKEFLLPGQGKRWNSEGTEAFYDALQMFGTDFMMISTLFPGTTRRSIKTKFNREERENPLRIKEALNGQRNSNWAEYLSRAGMEDDAFVDPTVIESELQEEREKMRVNIEAAKQAKAEEDRQKDLAGVLRDEKDGEKENEDGRRRKKRKEKPKTAGFEPEEGVEILPLDDED